MSPAPKKPLWSTKEGEDVDRAEQRVGFLANVDALVPEAASKLVEEVAEHFAAFVERTGVELPVLSEVESGPEGDGPDTELVSALIRWGEEWNLHRDAWILNHALGLLAVHYEDGRLDHLTRLGIKDSRPRYWVYWPERGAGLTYGVPPVPPENPEDLRTIAAMEAAGWETAPLWPYLPDLETRAQFLARADKYAKRVEAHYKAAGWHESHVRPGRQMHLKWLARYHIPRDGFPSGEPAPAIAKCPLRPGRREKKSYSEPHVRRKIAELAKFLPLAIRQD